MEYRDYYAALGVARDATPQQIKAAYRALARTLHPDVNKDASAEARFKRVNEAYEVLKDPAKRAKYDRLGADWEEIERREEALRRHRATAGAATAAGGAAGSGRFSDFFETFFGGGGVDIDDLLRRGGGSFSFRSTSGGSRPGPGHGPRRGHDIEDEVPIALAEALQGGVRLLSIGERTVEVRIPAGVVDGSVVRVAGEGGEGAGGGPQGDVLLRVRLQPDPRFTVRDRDLAADLPVRDDQAALGATVDVRGPLGSLQVSVPPGTPPGRTLRLRGRGLPALGNRPAGDLLLTVRLTQPSPLSDDELAAYRRLAELRTAG